jgi:hypothetical protein
MESLVMLVPEMLSPRDLQRRIAATASSARSSKANNRSSGDMLEGHPRSLSAPVCACPADACARSAYPDSSSPVKLTLDLNQSRYHTTRP